MTPKSDKDITHTHTHTHTLQASITDEYGCKTSQQNTSKLNPKKYGKDHRPWSSGIYPRDARIFQYSQINQRDTPHKQMNKSQLPASPSWGREEVNHTSSVSTFLGAAQGTNYYCTYFRALTGSRILYMSGEHQDWRQRFKLAWIFERLPKVFGWTDQQESPPVWGQSVNTGNGCFSHCEDFNTKIQEKMKKQGNKSQRNKLNLQKWTLMIQVRDLFDRIQANHCNVAHSGQEKCMNCSQS